MANDQFSDFLRDTLIAQNRQQAAEAKSFRIVRASDLTNADIDAMLGTGLRDLGLCYKCRLPLKDFDSAHTINCKGDANGTPQGNVDPA